MNIIFFGTPTFVLPVLQTLIDRFSVIGVITTPDRLVGRKQVITPPPVKVFALEHGIPVFQPKKLDIRCLTFDIDSIDFIVVASYGKIIPKEILDIPKYGALNIHPSALPKYRGPSPIQTAMLHDAIETEVDIIQMDAELDHGPVLSRKKLPINPDDTFASLVTKAFEIGAEMLPETIEQVRNGTITSTKQDHEKATYTKHFTRDSGYIDSQNLPPKEQIERMIRAFYPWPNVWTRIDEKIIKFFPGQMVQMEGKSVVSKKDFLNGYPQFREIIEKIL